MSVTETQLQGSSEKLPRHKRRQNQALSAALKRAFDLTLAILILPAIAPTILVLSILTKRDGGPGFFGHVRVGQNDKDFRCWKIRTMVVDSAKVLEEHLSTNPDAAAEWERDFKLKDDPRVTRLGRFLRETSLDELPQIWNVLRGEMSFVGPRPVTRVEMEKYRGFEQGYLSCKPGITGMWQVSGRNDVDYDERVRMDAEYAENRSLLGDALIVAKTAGAVMNRTGY